MRIEILSAAIEDLHRGRLFYERQGDGLGEYFFDSVFADIDSLVLFAGIHIEVFDHYRMLCRRFPFAVYYKVEGDAAIVFRVLDLRSNPGKLESSLGRREERDAH